MEQRNHVLANKGSRAVSAAQQSSPESRIVSTENALPRPYHRRLDLDHPVHVQYIAASLLACATGYMTRQCGEAERQR
jgi:hypothetical protein